MTEIKKRIIPSIPNDYPEIDLIKYEQWWMASYNGCPPQPFLVSYDSDNNITEREKTGVDPRKLVVIDKRASYIDGSDVIDKVEDKEWTWYYPIVFQPPVDLDNFVIDESKFTLIISHDSEDISPSEVFMNGYSLGNFGLPLDENSRLFIASSCFDYDSLFALYMVLPKKFSEKIFKKVAKKFLKKKYDENYEDFQERIDRKDLAKILKDLEVYSRKLND